MKIGVKTYDNEKFLEFFKDKSDFFEIQAIQANNYDFIKKFSLPIVIHAEHSGFGINSADKLIFQKNLDSINFAINLANISNAKKIISHPGVISNKFCSKKEAINFYKNIMDKRILLENLVFNDIHQGSLCTSPEETLKFMNLADKGFCLDINHAIASANSLNLNPINFLKKFISLRPLHYHIGGQKNKSKKDGHLNFKDSEIDVKGIFSLLPKDAEITIETTVNIEETKNDLIFLKNIINELSSNL